MSDIFEAGGLGPPKEKRFKMMKRSIKVGQVKADLYFAVLGMQKYDESGFPTRLDFADFNTVQPLNIIPSLSGTIYFLVRITYRLTSGLMKTDLMPSFGVAPLPGRMSLGTVHYRASFDYTFIREKDGTLDLKVQPADVTASSGDDDHEGDDDLTVALSDLNPRVQGGDGGPDYVSINPSVLISPTSSGGTAQGGFNLEIVSGSVASNDSVTAVQPGNAVGFGSFKIPIHVQTIPSAKVDGAPEDFKDDMALRLDYKDENDAAFSPDKQQKALDFITKINKGRSLIADAARNGELTLYANGFASKTGSPLYNQQLSQKRLKPVLDYVAAQLAIPVNKISGKPMGSQDAQWYWTFDAKGGAVKGPQADDRRVAVYFDVDAAWKVQTGSK